MNYAGKDSDRRLTMPVPQPITDQSELGSCIVCGHEVGFAGSKFCRSHHNDSQPRKVTERTALKQEAAFLRKAIRKLENLRRQRQAVKDLRAKLEDLQYEEEHGYPPNLR